MSRSNFKGFIALALLVALAMRLALAQELTEYDRTSLPQLYFSNVGNNSIRLIAYVPSKDEGPVRWEVYVDSLDIPVMEGVPSAYLPFSSTQVRLAQGNHTALLVVYDKDKQPRISRALSIHSEKSGNDVWIVLASVLLGASITAMAVYWNERIKWQRSGEEEVRSARKTFGHLLVEFEANWMDVSKRWLMDDFATLGQLLISRVAAHDEQMVADYLRVKQIYRLWYSLTDVAGIADEMKEITTLRKRYLSD